MKTCSRCKQEKSIDLFSNNKRKKDGKLPYCKECQKNINARYFLENKQKYYEHNKKTVSDKRKKLVEYKSTLSCQECGENKPWRLDFHHINDDKEGSVSSMIRTHSWNKILKEISKCVVVCRNCHADIHYYERIGPMV
jgi:hypothetical protein